MEKVNPTRMALMTRQRQMKLARQGSQMLRRKQEALVREFLEELNSFADLRGRMRDALVEAVNSLIEALAVDGSESVASAALASRQPCHVQMEEQNIWGTKAVKVETSYSRRSPEERKYTVAGATSRVDETADEFEGVLEMILRIAPVERKLRALAEDIRKTRRRVNALEQRLIPSLSNELTYIRKRLDQREREQIYRLKRFKKKHGRNA